MAKHDHEEELMLRTGSLRGAGGMLLAPQAAQAEGELERLQAALRASDERMSNMLESITDGFALIDRDWRIRYLNARAADMLGGGRAAPAALSGQPLSGLSLWQQFPDLCGTLLETEFRHAVEHHQTVGFELFYEPARRWLEVRAYPSNDGLSSYIQDITQRKADERALRDSNSRLRVALSAGKLGEWSWDAASGLITLGRRAAAIFELPAEAPLSVDTLLRRLLPESQDEARSAVSAALKVRGDFHIDGEIVATDGRRRYLAIVGHGDYGDDAADTDNRLQGMTGIVQDITQRKEAEKVLRRSEQELRALADSIPQLAWIAHADGALTWYNQRWYDYTGCTPAQMADSGWESAFAPDCLAQLRQHWQAALRSGEPFEMEIPIRGADGQFRWFLTRANPAGRGSCGQRWFGTCTDVDQVKRVQEALRDESKVLELLNHTGTALARTRELHALLQEVTEAATSISGARFGAFFYDSGGQRLHTLSGARAAPSADQQLPGPDLGDEVLRIDDLQDGPRSARRSAELATTLTRCLGLPPGQTPLRSVLAVAVLSRSGQRVGSLLLGHPEAAIFNERSERIVGGIAAQAAVAIDNTCLFEAARQAAEERKQLLDSERGARAEAERTSRLKDEFLATLSHELRTPLSAILGWAQVLRRGDRNQADLHRGLQTIERNARAQAQLIEDLLDMSRIASGKVVLDMQAVPVASILDAVIEALRPAADAKQIHIERQLEPGVGAVAGDPGRLQQVMWNLLSNALKFTARDGRVGLAARAAGSQVEITVTDNGAGIEADFLPYVFERFRQADASATRQHGGLGLGLAIVKQLVEQHGGSVSAASDGARRGACFTLLLPSAPARVR